MNIFDTLSESFNSLKEPWVQNLTTSTVSEKQRMTSRAEPITVNRMLVWTTGIVGTVFTLGTAAMVTSILSMRDGQTETRTTLTGLKETVGELKSQVIATSIGRYTTTDAATFQTTVLSTVTSMRETWSGQIKSLSEENATQGREIANLRVSVAKLEALNRFDGRIKP